MNEDIILTEAAIPEPVIHKKPVLAWLAKSIFVGSIVELVKGIGRFFAEHIKLLLESFRVVWYPFYKGTRPEMEVLMNRSQAVFGFLLTVLGFLIFMIKIKVIDEPDENLAEKLGDETSGILMNIYFFFVLAIGYFIFQALFVMLGRLYRFIASPSPNTAAYDMLFVSMGNQVFILAAFCGLILRLFLNSATIDAETHGTLVWMASFLIIAILHLIILIRLLRKQPAISLGRRILYTAVIVIIHSLVTSLICFFLSFVFLGI